MEVAEVRAKSRAKAHCAALAACLGRLLLVVALTAGGVGISAGAALADPGCLSLPNTGTQLSCPSSANPPPTFPGVSQLPDLPAAPSHNAPIICHVSGGSTSCHRETEQEEQDEAAGKVFEDIICLATRDPSCLFPPPPSGTYKLDPSQQQISLNHGGPGYLG